MKRCVKCAAVYDDEMSFCLNDGANLVSENEFESNQNLPPTVFISSSSADRQSSMPTFSVPGANSDGGKANASSKSFFTSSRLFVGAAVMIVGLLAAGGAIAAVVYYSMQGNDDKSNRVVSAANVNSTAAPNANTGKTNGSGANNTGSKTQILKTDSDDANKNGNSSADNSSSGDSEDEGSKGLDDFIPAETGGFTRAGNSSIGDAVKDGFPGALEERQYKYNKDGDFALHVTGVLYASSEKAQGALRTLHDEWKKKGLKVGEIDDQQTDAGVVDGIGFAVTTDKGFYVYVKTENEYLVRALGSEQDVDKFINSF